MFTQLPLIKAHMLPDDVVTERDSARIDGAEDRS
jgi:hypothetical protein